MKKLGLLLVAASTAGMAMAWHGCPPPPPHHWGPGPCHGGWGWGRGGCNFWPGFVGGVIGGAVASSWARPCYSTPVVVAPSPVVVTQPVVTQPVVVQQPVVQQQVVTQPVVQQTVVTQPRQVWVEGCYINQTAADGTVTRVWNPGHYEVR